MLFDRVLKRATHEPRHVLLPTEFVLSPSLGRMRKLEHGLAEPLGPARWRLSDIAEPTLLALGERDAPIKRILRSLTE
jgi:hypothetical protein